MSTITAILEPDSDGCVHLHVPEEMRGGKVRVIASVVAEKSTPESLSEAAKAAIAQKVETLNPVSPEAAARVTALLSLSASLQARGVDFEQWQRDIRESRR